MNSKQKDQLLLISLARITFLSLTEKLNLLKKLDSFNDLALLSIEDIEKECGRKIRAVWNGPENLLHAERELSVMHAKKIKSVFYSDFQYPVLLRQIVNAPFMLFYYGDVSCLAGKTVSVVGTRRITTTARNAAMTFGYDAVNDSCTVVSGLANGIDGAAHTGAVNACFDAMEAAETGSVGKTCAVLPCGIDQVVPSGHRKLAENIIRTGGCVLSEYVPGVPGDAWRFVARNRIIAALSPATVVVQAPCGSGALITADYAMESGRDVMFHKAAFTEDAVSVREKLDSRLKQDFACGKVSRAKLENTPEKYIESGAPIIENYEDYKRCLLEEPGTRSYRLNQNGQLKLPNL